MSSQYISQYPSTPEVPASLRTFFQNFYQISDAPDAHEDYADFFTKDALVIVGSARHDGRDGIISLRHNMWSKVSSRSHHPAKIFTFNSPAEAAGDVEPEVMIYGTVEYGLKAGGNDSKDWAARAVLTPRTEIGEGNEGWKMKFYQVYLDSAPKSK